MAQAKKILIVDDDEPTTEFIALRLQREQYETETALGAGQAIELLQSSTFDALVTDLAMPGVSGFDLCERAHEIDERMPIVVVTGQGGLETAVRAMRVGAHDFITKPIDADALVHRLARAIEHSSLSREVSELRQSLARTRSPSGILGESRAMRRVYDLITRVGPAEASVLILGESGTGKELAARAIHEASERAKGPFIAINCAAVPSSLLESELFGHVKGAFTDARTNRQGMFSEANGGTLFLDEIGEVPIEMQPKLLRALQERKIRPVGSSQEHEIDVRIVAATNVDLEAKVEAGELREDLLYRLDVVRLDLPPLRERGRDILLIAQHFLQRYGPLGPAKPTSLAETTAAKLLAYDWPGNVRELENCMQRSAALARSTEIMVDDLPEKVRDYQSDHVDMRFENADDLVTLDELQSRYIRRVLAAVGGNKSRAARILGLDRRSLYRRLDKYENQQ